MENGKYCIAIMSVGSGVGQSVMTSLNLSRMPFRTVGLDMNPMAFGAYECDVMDYIPNIHSDDYIPELKDRCRKHRIDLIIPGLDDEALILIKNRALLEQEGYKVLASDAALISLIRDKKKMCDELSTVADIFVKSYDHMEIKSLVRSSEIGFPLIAKPRGGSASEGIEILLDENDLSRVSENHIIQELAVPHQMDPFRETYLQQVAKRVNPQLSEISIQVVADKNGELIGKMASCNKLKNGVPIEIIPYENEYIWSEIDRLLPTLKKLGHKGPLNIQGRLTDKGLKIFEMNARFTGITGLRAIMGFNEVEACIMDWLDIPGGNESLVLNYDRIGIRQVAERVISYDKNRKIKELSQKINKKEMKASKTVLVTGASGYLGQRLVEKLLASGYEVWVASREKEKIEKLFRFALGVKCYSNKEILEGSFSLGQVDTIIHCAFARAYKGNAEIIESLSFTNSLFSLAAIYQVPSIINISSQSVYGTRQPVFWTEETPAMPETFYGQAKFSTELMAETVRKINKHANVTSIRLSALSGGQSGLVPTDILSTFVQRVINDDPIEIADGRQKTQRFDVRDAADGIVALLKTNPDEWQPVYNLGVEDSYTILEMAEKVVEVGKERFGKDGAITIYVDDIDMEMCLDSSQFYLTTKWKPKHSLEDIIESLFAYHKGEGMGC